MLRRASTRHPPFTDRIAPMKMSGLLSRNTTRPGLTGTARVDRNIDRLLRRVCPGDIVVLDVLDLDRITADALVEADVAAVINASPSVSGRYPNLAAFCARAEVLPAFRAAPPEDGATASAIAD